MHKYPDVRVEETPPSRPSNVYEGYILHLENEYSPGPQKKLVPKKPGADAEHVAYDLDYHLGNTSPQMRKLMQEIREKILQLPSVEEKLGQKTGITYRTTRSFARFEFRKTWIQVLLREAKHPEDVAGLVKDITSNEWGYLGMVKSTPASNLDYIFTLIESSYKSTL